MKKYSIKLASLMLFFATSGAMGMRTLDPGISVYVINKAVGLGGKKYTIYTKAIPEFGASVGKFGTNMGKETPVAYGEKAYLANLHQIADVQTSGDYSGWTPNKNVIDQLKQEAISQNYQDTDLYLHVIPSKTGYYINSWHWAESEAQAKPSNLTSFITLQDVVKQNSLGQNYAKMVIEICNTDYTKAEQSGASNICSDLKRMFTRGLSEADAKRIIDGMYARLKMYKTPQGITQIIYVD